MSQPEYSPKALEWTARCTVHKFISGCSTESRWHGSHRRKGEKVGDWSSSSGDRCSDLSSSNRGGSQIRRRKWRWSGWQSGEREREHGRLEL